MKKLYILLVLTVSFALSTQAQWLWNRDKMETVKAGKNTLAYSNAYKALIRQADRSLSGGTYSVTYKKAVAPPVAASTIM